MKSSELSDRVFCATTNIAADVCKGASELVGVLRRHYHTEYQSVERWEIRCPSHVLSFTLKEGLEGVLLLITDSRTLLACLCCWVKRRDVNNAVCVELGLNIELHLVDCDTRWSSSFKMVRGCFKARRILNTDTALLSELAFLDISETFWANCDKVYTFLEKLHDVTENQSDRQFVTLSMPLRLFECIGKVLRYE